MKTETEYLRSIAEDIAAKPMEDGNNLLPDKHLVAEADRLQKQVTAHLLGFDNFPQRESFYFNTLNKLVEICDTLFEVGNTASPDVMVLIGLLTEVKKVIPAEISPNLQLPKAFIFLQREVVLEGCKKHCDVLKEQGVEPKLVRIAAVPFKRFAGAAHKQHWRNYTWLKGYQEKLDNIDWEDADCNSKTEAVISLLLSCAFNDDQFFIYCKRYLVARTKKLGTQQKRMAEFAECEKLILQDTLDDFPSYNHRRPPIRKKLIDWIRIEVEAIKAGAGLEEADGKIEFNLDSESLSIFWKHLMEHGVTKVVPLDLYAKKIAATCSSKDTGELKWTTIKSKFHLKNPKYLQKVVDPLVAIVGDMKRFLKP